MPKTTKAPLPGPVELDQEFLQSVDGLTDLQGQEYINHRGLLALGHRHGLIEVVVTMLDFSPETGHAIVSATVKGDRGTFTDIADASPSNVGPRTANATPRMASTRSINRALRLYLGIGATTAEEIGPESRQASPQARAASSTRQPQQRRSAAASQQAQPLGPTGCPECGTELWDNRDRRVEGWRGPSWKCRDNSCIGHMNPKTGEEGPWIQWDPMPWPSKSVWEDLTVRSVRADANTASNEELEAASEAFSDAVAAANAALAGDVEVPF